MDRPERCGLLDMLTVLLSVAKFLQTFPQAGERDHPPSMEVRAYTCTRRTFQHEAG
jgi:hypothetical protein